MLCVMLIKTRGAIFKGPWSLKGVLISSAGLAAYQLTFFSAVRLTGVAVGTMVAVGCAPPIASIFGAVLFRERPTVVRVISTCVSVAGCVMLVLGGTTGSLHVSAAGVVLALGAAVSYALEGVGLRYVKRDSLEASAVTCALSGLFTLPFLFAGGAGWLFEPRGAVCAAFLAVVSTAVPFTLFVTGIRRVSLGAGYTLSLSEPLTAWLLSAVVLGERLSALGTVGGCVLLLGIALTALEGRRG